MKQFACPYLHADVQLTDERYQHIVEQHPELLPEQEAAIGETLAEPEEIRADVRFPRTHLFSKWFDQIRNGKYVIVDVVSDPAPKDRHWIVTAYISRRLSQGETLWRRISL